MENDRVANKVYVGKCAGSHSVGRLRKRWIDTAKDCLGRRGLDVRQARRMVQYRSVRRGVYEGESMGHSPGNVPQTLMRCHSCGLSKLNEVHGWKSVCGQA